MPVSAPPPLTHTPPPTPAHSFDGRDHSPAPSDHPSALGKSGPRNQPSWRCPYAAIQRKSSCCDPGLFPEAGLPPLCSVQPTLCCHHGPVPRMCLQACAQRVLHAALSSSPTWLPPLSPARFCRLVVSHRKLSWSLQAERGAPSSTLPWHGSPCSV